MSTTPIHPLETSAGFGSLPRRTFLFLRHGETDWNAEGRIQGHTDIPLNANGVAQAEAAALRVARHTVHRIVASPLRRAFDTAQAVAGPLGLPVDVDDGLKERAFGRFEGRTLDDVKITFGTEATRSLRKIMPADAEPWEATLARSVAAVARWLAAHPGDTVLFVSHAGPFRALHERLVGIRHEAKNATPYLFAPAGRDGWTVEELGPA